MEAQVVSRKLVSGFVSLVARKAILDALSFITIFVVLAKILPISVIGVFSIASGFLSFFSYFSDFGLSASLIQKKNLLHEDLKTAFLIQESLGIAIGIVVWFVAPLTAGYYHLGDEGMWLIRSLGVGFFLTTLKTIPSNLLERELKFEPLVLVDVVEALVFNGLLIYLVFSGLGVLGFAWATLGRSVVGVVVIYILSPWKVAFGLSKTSTKELLHFGVPFQLNSLLALLKDRLTPLITAKIVGAEGTGYLTWAQGIAYRPLEVMNIVIRITFPAFSRLQDNPSELKKIVEKSLFLTTFFLYPLLFGLLAIAPSFIEFMGKNKFAPALHLIYLFAFSTFWAAPSTTFTNVLNAVGKVGITLKLMIMWTLLTWTLSPVLAIYYGFTGVAVAAAIISFSSIVPIIIVVRMIKLNVISIIYKQLLASILMSVLVYFYCFFFARDALSLVSAIFFGGLVYFSVMFMFDKRAVIDALRRVKRVK